MPFVLGLEEIQSGYRIRGEFDLSRILMSLDKLIRFVGMAPAGEWAYKIYGPEDSEKGGGVGVQGKRDLVESWVLFSTWPAHGFLRITLASCKPYDVEAVAVFLGKELGPVVKCGQYDL